MKARCSVCCLFNVYASLMSLELDFEEFDSGFRRLPVFVPVNQDVWFFSKRSLETPVTSKKDLNFIGIFCLFNK